MPKMRWSDIPDNNEYPVIPEGLYLSKLIQVDKVQSKGGYEQWKLRWEVVAGTEGGKLIFDQITFGDIKSLTRCKFVAHRLGIDTAQLEGQDFEPSHILGKKAYVRVVHSPYEGKMQAKVPFDGYDPEDATEHADIPF